MTRINNMAAACIATWLKELSRCAEDGTPLLNTRLESDRLHDALNAQTIEVIEVGAQEFNLRVLSAQHNVPRYFTVKVSEQR